MTIPNEIGLDPGIDHLYAVKTIDEVHREGGYIEAFTSYYGAHPALKNSRKLTGLQIIVESPGVACSRC